MITPDQFEIAVKSLSGYFGVVGMFGGCPTVHPKFDVLCEIFRASDIPFERRGLWANDLCGKGAICRETFNPAVSNLNVHLDQKAFDEFKTDWPESRPFGLHEDSRHSPVHGSMIDIGVPEAERWERISRCPINQRWSSLVGVFRNQVRAWFCEVAAAQAMLRQHDPKYPDSGIAVDERYWYSPEGERMIVAESCDNVHPVKWWQLPMTAFRDQVRQHCHNCLVPMQGHGELAAMRHGVEQTTASYADVFKPKTAGRRLEIIERPEQLGTP
jgi:hypothetical protein